MISGIIAALLEAEQGNSKHSYQADRKEKRRVSSGAAMHSPWTLLQTPIGRPSCKRTAVGSPQSKVRGTACGLLGRELCCLGCGHRQ